VIVPFLLVLIILGSIWINFSFSTLSDVAIIFLGYIIITAIQMGATIDYAIIITGRYKEFRREYDKYHSVTEAIRVSIPTLLTSGGILIVSGLCVGFVSTASSISNLGILIGRGAFISLIMVIFFLPQLLLICDKVVL
jgi:predicted RND superfamily exporter protein